MSGQAIKTDSHEVVVNSPVPRRVNLLLFLLSMLCLSVNFLAFLPLILGRCHRAPNLALEDLSIRSMTVYPNSTVADQWHVKSEFNVTLSARNKNTVAGCFSAYRRMVVYVKYHDKLLLQQEVPLGFELKPRRSRPVEVELKGDHFPMTQQLGQLLDAELRNASSVKLQMYFDTRVMRNDRKAKWIHMGCEVLARAPRETSQATDDPVFLARRIWPTSTDTAPTDSPNAPVNYQAHPYNAPASGGRSWGQVLSLQEEGQDLPPAPLE